MIGYFNLIFQGSSKKHFLSTEAHIVVHVAVYGCKGNHETPNFGVQIMKSNSTPYHGRETKHRTLLQKAPSCAEFFQESPVFSVFRLPTICFHFLIVSQLTEKILIWSDFIICFVLIEGFFELRQCFHWRWFSQQFCITAQHYCILICFGFQQAPCAMAMAIDRPLRLTAMFQKYCSYPQYFRIISHSIVGETENYEAILRRRCCNFFSAKESQSGRIHAFCFPKLLFHYGATWFSSHQKHLWQIWRSQTMLFCLECILATCSIFCNCSARTSPIASGWEGSHVHIVKCSHWFVQLTGTIPKTLRFWSRIAGAAICHPIFVRIKLKSSGSGDTEGFDSDKRLPQIPL